MITLGNVSIKTMLATVRSVYRDSLQEYNKTRNGSGLAVDFAMACLSIFYFKWPSLLLYDKQRSSINVKPLFGINHLPSDTQMRCRLDEVEPSKLRGAFKSIFAMLQRNKVLESYVFLDDHYLVSIDGTGQFSSKEIHCDNCCVKGHKDGTVTYYHQLVGASLVHPGCKQVIPFAPEPIMKQDGK